MIIENNYVDKCANKKVKTWKALFYAMRHLGYIVLALKFIGQSEIKCVMGDVITHHRN